MASASLLSLAIKPFVLLPSSSGILTLLFCFLTMNYNISCLLTVVNTIPRKKEKFLDGAIKDRLPCPARPPRGGYYSNDHYSHGRSRQAPYTARQLHYIHTGNQESLESSFVSPLKRWPAPGIANRRRNTKPDWAMICF